MFLMFQKLTFSHGFFSMNLLVFLCSFLECLSSLFGIGHALKGIYGNRFESKYCPISFQSLDLFMFDTKEASF